MGGVVFVSNFLLLSESGYFDTEAVFKPLLHLWSLGIEEQFYLVWPVLCVAANKLKIRLWSVALLVGVLSFVANLATYQSNAAAAYYLPSTRVWAILAGALIALATRQRVSVEAGGAEKSSVLQTRNSQLPSVLGRLSREVFSVVGLLLLTIGFVSISEVTPFPGFAALLPVLGAICLVAAGGNTFINQRLLSASILVKIGLVSFPLYLWHWPVLSFARIANGGEVSVLSRVLCVGVAGALSVATYYVIEYPIRFGKFRKVAATILTFPALGLALMSVGLLRQIPDVPSWTGEDDPVAKAACLSKIGLEDDRIRYCKSVGMGLPKLALIGDSHAAAMFPAIADIATNEFRSLLMVGGRLYHHALAFPVGSGFEENVARGGRIATQHVMQMKEVETVVIVGRGPVYLSESWNLFFEDKPELTNKVEVLRIELTSLLEKFDSRNIKIIFVLENPTLPFDPTGCYESKPWRRSQCSFPKSDYVKEHAKYQQLISQVAAAFKSVSIVDPSEVLCSHDLCHALLDGRALYVDEHHLSLDGAKLVARQIIDAIQQMR